MGIHFTPQQEKVLNARKHNILVSAAAGSGKTAVLVERIIRMITEGDDPMDIDRLLVVTFTRAAAAQMRERISEAIAKRLQTEPDNEHLQRQETLMHNARITTMDSFFASVVRNQFSEIGLDPSFRQIDEDEARILEADVMDAYLEKLHTDKDPAFTGCLEFFCQGGPDTVLAERIRRLYSCASSHPDPEEWVRRRGEDYEVKDEDDLLGKKWLQLYLCTLLEDTLDVFTGLDKAIEICREPDGPAPYEAYLAAYRKALFEKLTSMLAVGSLSGGSLSDESLSGESLSGGSGTPEPGAAQTTAPGEDVSAGAALRAMEAMENMVAEGTMTSAQAGALWEALRRIAEVDIGRLPTIGKKAGAGISKVKQDRVKKLRERVKKDAGAVSKKIGDKTPQTECALMQRISPFMRDLSGITLGYMETLAAVKREKNVADFSDLEHFALQILARKTEDGTYVPGRAALAYRKHFDEILIDEYQDSNDVQELILRIISTEDEGRPNRFMVGDVKQSIYKFRQARPEIFNEKYKCYRQDDPLFERIDLDRNFRSRREVLESVNAVFARIMREEIGGVQYDSGSALKTGASYQDPAAFNTETAAASAGGSLPGPVDELRKEDPYVTELMLIETAADEEGAENEDDPSGMSFASLNAARKEALMVSARIRELVGRLPVSDGEQGTRPCRFGDIVILLRSPKGWDEDFREILESQGIPVYVESRTGYFEAREIRTVLALLKVLDNPLQDIPLYGVMTSYFGRFTPEDCAKLRILSPEGSLWSALQNCAGVGAVPAALRDKARRFVSFIDNWRSRRRWLSVHVLLEEILEQTGYEDHCCALPGGEQRGANLHLLRTQACAFDRMQVSGLFSFVRYIEQIRRREIDYGEANVLGENADVVRIMSIHKSKGLEFPVCFVSGLSKGHAFLTHDTSGPFIIDNDLGVGTEFYQPALRVRGKTLRSHAVAEKIKRDSLGEELRVLYVAMTRAKEKLILTGSVKDPAKAGPLWKDCIPEEMLTEAEDGGLPFPLTGDETKLPVLRIARSRSFMDLIGMSVCSVCPDLSQTDRGFSAQFCSGAGLEAKLLETLAGEDLAGKRAALEALENVPEESAYGPASGAAPNSASDTASDPGRGLPDPELAAALRERFSRRYAGENLSGLCTMTSVSELKKAAFAESGELIDDLGEEPGTDQGPAALFPPKEITPVIPFFSVKQEEQAEEREGSAGGAEYGTAIHRLMELFPYGRFPQPGSCTEQEMNEWREQLAREGRIPAEYVSGIPARPVMQFLSSPLAARMADADRKHKLFREQPFVLGVPAKRLREDSPEEETVMIQGIIDAFFEEGGELVLVDYKTDRVRSAQQLRDRYKVQISYYAEALERITGRKVKEKILYSFSLRGEVRIE